MKKCKRILIFMMSFILLLGAAIPVSATELAGDDMQDLGDAAESEEDTEDEEEFTGDEEELPEDYDMLESEEYDEDEELIAYINEAKEELKKVTGQEIIMALVYLCDSYSVKKTPGENGELCVQIPTGTT
ncbi:MAG: hypothetical protein HDR20_06705, partial [Lachnospiraceae bacterium]|nr:hypothetical protein [Lachnospiraceae bacterium]